MKTLKRVGSISAGLIVIAFVALAIFRLMFVNFEDNYEIVYRYDSAGKNAGLIQPQNRTGYFVTWPFITNIHHIDGRPFQVCITAIQRTLNCKLLQFNPGKNGEGIKLFVQWHGRNDYDNERDTGTDGTVTYSYFDQAMMNYAYDGTDHKYPFLTILPSATDSNNPAPAPTTSNGGN